MDEETRIRAISVLPNDLPSSYPALQDPEPLAKLAKAFYMLEAASLEEDRLVTWSLLGLDTSDGKSLLGTAWDKIYPDGHRVLDLLPRKVSALMRLALQRLSEQHARSPQQIQIARDAAEESLGQAEAKRLRST